MGTGRAGRLGTQSAEAAAARGVQLHPPFFSMGVWHLGHFFVFALMYFAVSLSLLFFSSHACSCAQLSG